MKARFCLGVLFTVLACGRTDESSPLVDDDFGAGGRDAGVGSGASPSTHDGANGGAAQAAGGRLVSGGRDAVGGRVNNGGGSMAGASPTVGGNSTSGGRPADEAYLSCYPPGALPDVALGGAGGQGGSCPELSALSYSFETCAIRFASAEPQAPPAEDPDACCYLISRIHCR